MTDLPPDHPLAPRPSPATLFFAFVAAAAPMVLQSLVLIATKSHAWTAAAGGALFVAFVLAALHLMTRGPAGRRPVPAGAVVNVALSILAYLILAFCVAHVAATLWFGRTG